MNENAAGLVMVDLKKFELLKEAYNNGEIKFKREDYYRGTPAKPGHIFYWIHFENNSRVIYTGAYEMLIEVEQELKRTDKLQAFLIFQLTNEI